MGCRGGAAAAVKHKPSFVHSGAASGAAQPPRPQGAGFRRKREPRGACGRAKVGVDAMRSNGGFGAGEVSPRRDAGAEQPRIWNYIIIKDAILYPQGESSQGERVTVTPETKLADASPGAPYISEPESTRVPSS